MEVHTTLRSRRAGDQMKSTEQVITATIPEQNNGIADNNTALKR